MRCVSDRMERTPSRSAANTKLRPCALRNSSMVTLCTTEVFPKFLGPYTTTRADRCTACRSACCSSSRLQIFSRSTSRSKTNCLTILILSYYLYHKIVCSLDCCSYEGSRPSSNSGATILRSRGSSESANARGAVIPLPMAFRYFTHRFW